MIKFESGVRVGCPLEDCMPHAETPSVARARRASPPWIGSISSIAVTVTSIVATPVTWPSFSRGPAGPVCEYNPRQGRISSLRRPAREGG